MKFKIKVEQEECYVNRTWEQRWVARCTKFPELLGEADSPENAVLSLFKDIEYASYGNYDDMSDPQMKKARIFRGMK